jgi:hypothetical protein
MASGTPSLGLAPRRARRCAWLILAALGLVGVTQGVLAAQSLAESVTRADQILMLLGARTEFELQAEYLARLSRMRELLPELETLTATEYTVPIEIAVRRYEPDEGYFPVTVHRADLIEPGIEGRVAMPRAIARRAKAALNAARATVRIGIRSRKETRAEPAVTSVWVFAEGKRWPMTSEDPRLADAGRGPNPPTTAFHVTFDEKSGSDIAASSGPGGWVTGQPIWEDGRRDGSLRFDGTTRASFPNEGYLRSFAYPLTIGMWIWLEEDTGAKGMWDASWTHLAEMWPGEDEYGWVLLIRDWTFEWATTTSRARAFRPLTPRVWHHMSVVATGKSVTWYIDGVPSGTTYQPHTLRTDHPDIKALDIGDRWRSGAFAFKGKLDDMVVIRGALTEDGVRELMRGVYPTHAAVDEALMVPPHAASATTNDPLPPLPSPQTVTYQSGEPGMQSAIARVEEILNVARAKDEFESTPEYGERIGAYNALIPELRAIAKLRFDVAMTVEDIGRYDADTELFPVTVSKEGFLPASTGTVAIPRSKARSAKSRLRKAWAIVQVRVVPATREVVPYPEGISVRFQDKMWPVEFQGAWVPAYTLNYAANGGITTSSDGSVLAVAAEDGVALHGVATGEIIRWLRPADIEMPRQSTYVMREAIMEFSPDGSRIVEGSAKFAQARVWHVADGAFDHHLPIGYGFQDVSFHPDGDRLAIALYSPDGLNGTVRIWSVSSQAVVDEFVAHDRRVASVQYVNEGRQLVTGGHNLDGRVHVWDMASGQRIRTLLQNVHPKVGPSATWIDAYYPSSAIVAISGWGAHMSYWNTNTWAELGKASIPGYCMIAPDGLTYVALDSTRRVHSVSATDHAEWQVLPSLPVAAFGEDGNVKAALSFTSDGRSLALARAGEGGGPVHVLWRVGAVLPDIPINPLVPSGAK